MIVELLRSKPTIKPFNYSTIIFSFFKIVFRIGLRHWRSALIIYVIQFLLALTIGLQVYQVVEASIGNSLELNKLLNGYSETVVKDFLNTHGASLSPLVGQLRYLILVYVVFVVFLNAGALNCIVKNEPRWKSFWKGGAEYFSRFLLNALFFIFITLVWAGILWGPFVIFFPVSAEYFSSEIGSMYLMFALMFVFLFGLFFLFNWSVIARLEIISENRRTWPAIKNGFYLARKKYFSVTGLFLLFFFIELIFIGIYWLAEGASGMVSPGLILVFFLVQQFLIIIRIMARLMMYAGVDVIMEK